MSFSELNLSENVLNAIKNKGFEKPTDIQMKVVPLFLNESCNIVAQARTGSGKTASFAIPLIELIDEDSGIEAIILTPTRELAIQVADEIDSLKGNKNLKITKVYGGKAIHPQIKALKKANIVVGTPGRVLDHINRGTLNLKNVKYFILDEADEMLNMGFIEDVEKILNACNKNKRILLFSATMPKEILNLAKKYMGDYEFVKAKINANIEQSYIEINENERFETLCRILKDREFYGLVFCKTKKDTKDLANMLRDIGFKAGAIHGDLNQSQREKVIRLFKQKKIKILIATDVMSRGIDVNDLNCVINYHLPQNPESYMHRIGRTGRAGKKGMAISIINRREYRKLKHIERKMKLKIRKLKIK
ncbi:DEAD/DEAH box helicase [Methanocaldococcus fervens]|uniref:RNA helicase n=1 Tax=Methanocaldococcus fervens (strain DSM 4213 / JCM 15782 / AG86) TaxID=573064 RepID=C7P9H6_METFA|nr:DEAD/DEAH box helicase [Methanocaldococcus fervens]ACV25208.1 DEAD/DEAH box helicase domain protein [Methanocaldococcus fervens AG86]